MKRIHLLIGICLLLFLTEQAAAQPYENIRINGRYKNTPLRDILHEWQQKHTIQFFFVDQQIDTLKVTVAINNQRLESALTMILSVTKLRYLFDITNKRVSLYFDEKKSPARPQKNVHTITGTAIDETTNETLPSVHIYIPGLQRSFITDNDGKYVLKDLPEDVHVIQYSFIGYSTVERKVVLNKDVRVDISLTENVVELEALEVSPSSYEVNLDEPSSYSISGREIFHSPNLAKDVSRTLRVLPGIASNDYSAKPRIRGGSTDESVFYLDNFEIIAPFHFEEFDGLFSIINSDYVSTMKLIPGGFSPTYTDKISGVIDISSASNVQDNTVAASVDLINTSLLLKQKINSKLDIQMSARRTYVDLVLGLNDNDAIQLDPVYLDAWAKVNYRANDKNTFAFNFLHATDRGTAQIRESNFNWIDMEGKRNDDYLWVNWKGNLSSNYQHITTAGYQRLDKKSTFSFNNTISNDNLDHRSHGVIALSHTSFVKIGEHNMLEAGGDFKHFTSADRFTETRYNNFISTMEETVIDSIDVDAKYTTTLAGIFLQNTFQFTDQFHVTAGARLSYFSRSENSVVLAPRFVASYDFLKNFNLKIGYGIYNQAAYPTEAKLYDGNPFPTEQNKQSVHYSTSLSYTTPRTNVTLNGYFKDNKKLYDDYRYDAFNRLGGGISILDQSFVTTSGYSKGLEAIVRHTYGKGSSLMVSYAYAINRIRNDAGEETYRDNDRRHTFLINNLWNLKRNWVISVYSIFYTGEPYTPSTVKFIGENEEQKVVFYNLGPKNSERLPSFYSLDVRFDKTWYFKKWQLNVYLNMINLTGHRNVRNYFWVPEKNAAGDYNANCLEELYLSDVFVTPGIYISF